ncbi:MAG: RNA polymerase sigma factor [bacterium]|nr:RNA polymerase sigma factor [bacterium]
MDSVPDLDALLADRRWLRSLARSLVRQDDVDDLVQDATAAALGARPAIRGRPAAWLLGTMRRLAANRRRANARRLRREAVGATGGTTEPASSLVERTDLERRIAEAIRDLPGDNRQALVMRFWEGLRPGQISDRLRLPTEAVRSRIRRGLATLRGRLDELHPRRAWMTALDDRTWLRPWLLLLPIVAALGWWLSVAGNDRSHASERRPRFAWVRTLDPNGERLDLSRVGWRGLAGEFGSNSGLVEMPWPSMTSHPEPLDGMHALVCAHRVGPATEPQTFTLVAAKSHSCAGIVVDRFGNALAGALVSYRLPREVPWRLALAGDVQFGPEPSGNCDGNGAFDLGNVASCPGATLVIEVDGRRVVSNRTSGRIQTD